MNKLIKSLSALLALILSVGLYPTYTKAAARSEVETKKYEVEIVNTGYGPFWFANDEILTSGKSMTIEYSVKSLTNYSRDGDPKKLCVVSTDTHKKIYPGVATYCAYSNMFVNGAEVNSENKVLPENYFKNNEKFSIEFTPSKGSNYSWKYKDVNGSIIDNGEIEYRGYFGVGIYGFSFEMTLTSVTVNDGEKDLGVWAFNGGSMVYKSKVIDISQLTGGTFFKNDSFSVEGAAAELCEEGYLNGNAIKMTLTSSNSGLYLYLPELQNIDIYADVHISLRLKIEKKTAVYGNLALIKSGGIKFDYALPRNTWNNINYESNVYVKNGKKYVWLGMNYAKNETVYISFASATVKTQDKNDMLGGVTLYQMNAVSSLMMGYVMITDDNKLIVIDGGDNADADNLIKFIRSFKNEVDGWFISHYHSDHVNALIKILNNYDIKINNLYYDFSADPDELELYGDSNNYCIAAMRNAVNSNRSKISNIIVPHKGDSYEFGTLKIKVLNDAYFAPGNNYVNDSSIVYKAETSKESILFLGDLGLRGDDYMKDKYFVSEAEVCRIIQMAHHGQNGVSAAFYDMIKDIKVCLYPALAWVYDNNTGGGINSGSFTSLDTRNAMRERGVMFNFSETLGRIVLK